MPKVGDRFLGTVVKTAAFGAFVSLLPGRDGLLHISKVGDGKRVEQGRGLPQRRRQGRGRDRRHRRPRQDLPGQGRAPRAPRRRRPAATGRPARARRPAAARDRGDRDRGRDRGDRGRRRAAARRRQRPAAATAAASAATTASDRGDRRRRPARATRSSRAPHPDAGRRPAGRHGTPHRAAQRAAHPHRGDPGDAQRRRSASGSASARGTRPRRCPAPRTSWSTCCSRAPSSAPRWRSPRRSRRSAARPTPSPPRSTPATTRGCSTPTCRSPIDVMCDLVADSVLDPADVETERGVILEEIAMHDDEPGDEVHDLFAEAIYGDHPLGRLISGTAETISPMTRRADQRLLPAPVHGAARSWSPPPATSTTPTVVQAGPGGVRPAPPLGRRAGRARRRRRPAHRRVPAAAAGTRGAAQGHRAGAPGARLRRASAGDDERRFALGVLNNVLGGGMSSRLFQEIREQRGLAYSVYSYTASTPTPACSASTPAARRARSTRCST